MTATLHVCIDQFDNRYLMIVSEDGAKKLLVPITERTYRNLTNEGVPEYGDYIAH